MLLLYLCGRTEETHEDYSVHIVPGSDLTCARLERAAAHSAVLGRFR